MSKVTSKKDSTTPLMRQFNQIKAEHPDKILFFRMGDFYEMFGDDAVKAAPILGIALTSRSSGSTEKVPLAGVPYHSVDRYLSKMLSAGEKVVIVEQVEDPKTAKGLVKRAVVEILTPGTATIDDPGENNLGRTLAAVSTNGNKSTIGIALLDLATGSFSVDEGEREEVVERLRLVEPAEILHPSIFNRDQISEILRVSGDKPLLTPFEEWNFDPKSANRDLADHFGVTTLDGFGVNGNSLATGAAGAIFRYLKENHRDKLTHIRRIARFDQSEYMTLDYNSVRNLELVRNNHNNTLENSLLGVIDRCHTQPGRRRLQQALLRPFINKEKIELRLTSVNELVKNRDLAFNIREQTKQLPDLERLTGRLGIGKLNPRQMAGLMNALYISDKISKILDDCHSPHLQNLLKMLPNTIHVADKIKQALVDEPPLLSNKGNILKKGFSEELDNLNNSIYDARQFISSLQAVERERTGINTLKVGFNRVFGYYIEITKANSTQVPDNYLRKQTLVNAERYITEELKEKEELILAAEEKIFKLEEELYLKLVDEINSEIEDLIATSDVLSELDLVSSLGEIAVEKGFTRPEIYTDSRLNIINGRHPVIEDVLPGGSFVANDTVLTDDKKRIVILTGPNMSGKSTYLRQIGHIVILAQIGSFVPAETAEIGLVDRVFTRVGALDNLARGQSTFLVEMVETANILNNATDRSLVLLDEVGRGTSTYDGLSVAWSVVEFIHDYIKCRTIFATHYHELTAMADTFDLIENYQVAVKKWKDKVVFLHKIVEGGCDDSYGIEVARLAGLPKNVVSRSKQILKLLESGKFQRSELAKHLHTNKVQTSLFDPPTSVIEEAIRELDLDNLTPLQAFEELKRLKETMDDD